jgi:ribosome-associated protein
MTFPARDLAVHCARLVDQKGGSDVRVLHLGRSAHSFDFVVLVSAQSDRLTNALVEEVWHFCKRHQVPRMPVEGESGWMLIDCYDVVVHALTPDRRAFYQLDTLWPQAREVPWEKEAKQLGDPDRPAPASTSANADTPAAKRKKTTRKAAEKADEDAEKPAAKKKSTGKSTVKKNGKSAAAKAIPDKSAPKRRKTAPRARPVGTKIDLAGIDPDPR